MLMQKSFLKKLLLEVLLDIWSCYMRQDLRKEGRKIMENIQQTIQNIKSKEPLISADDVAQYITDWCKTNKQELTAMKLQKLLYYSQVWSIMKNGQKMFPEQIEAWQRGIVIPSVYKKHKGEFFIYSWDYVSLQKTKQNDKAKKILDLVLNNYGDRSGDLLSSITHAEEPWINANKRNNQEITVEDIYRYYLR